MKVYLIWEADGELCDLNCVSLDKQKAEEKKAELEKSPRYQNTDYDYVFIEEVEPIG